MTGEATDRPRLRLSAPVRRAILTLHIVVAVGLLGDSAGFLAVAIRGASSDDPAFARSCYELLRMFSVVIGIPLSFATLITGVTLGISSRWGIVRYPWTTAKLALIVSVILVGALVIDAALTTMLDGRGGAETRLITAAAWDVFALTTATTLAVYKPGRRRSPRRTPSSQSRHNEPTERTV
jgi:hypothetical protein